MSHLLNGVGILVTADTDKAFLALVFTASVSQASVLEGLLQGGARDCVGELDPSRTMEPDGLHLKVLRQLAMLLQGHSPPSFKCCEDGGRTPVTGEMQTL